LTETGRYTVINGDDLGHQALNDISVRNQIRHRFGDSVFDDKGFVNRAALGRLVFGPDEEHRRARADLERVVHPRIREGIIREIDAAHTIDRGRALEEGKPQPQYEAILLDAAVLFEAGWNDLCDAVVFIEVPEAIRLERVSRNRGWSAEELKKREASQLSLEEKRKRADLIIDNSGSITEAGTRLQAGIRQLQQNASNRP
jgi:dephospho-CoA kinase